MQLRDYQADSVASLYEYMRRNPGKNPLIEIPTGGGKTPVIGAICRDVVHRWGGRILVLSHVKELIGQAAEKISAIDRTLPVGVCSAGLGSKDLGYAVTVAGIQTIRNKAASLGKVDVILIDEAHMIPFDGDGMYLSFIGNCKDLNPKVSVVGLTATPYRMKGGLIYGEEHMFDDICYSIGVKELMSQGYLSKVRTKSGKKSAIASMDGVHTRMGEFVASEVSEVSSNEDVVRNAVAEIVELTQDRKSVLIFACSEKHGLMIQDEFSLAHGVEAEFVTGKTLASERDRHAEAFKAGRLKYLININVFTTGFDATRTDCVVMLRPTKSPGLYYQMVGRGFRLHHGKEDCLILDYGGNVERHGPVDQIKDEAERKQKGQGGGDAPMKVCPECSEIVNAGARSCTACGYEFPIEEKPRHADTAADGGVISGQVTIDERDVLGNPQYTVHAKRGAAPGDPRTLKVEYRLGINEYIAEWLCFEHGAGTFANTKARKWWRERSNETPPDTIEQAVEMARGGALAPTIAITVKSVTGQRFPEITGHKLGEKPEVDPKWAVKKALGKFEVRQDGADDYDNGFDLGGKPVYNADDIPF